MAPSFDAAARRLGVASGATVAALSVVYAGALAMGLLALDSPEEPIGPPILTVMEVLILALAPALVALMAAVHAWAGRSAMTAAALVFTGVLAGVTSAVHFLVLTLGHEAAFLAFTWPSAAYALDILAWDVFFPLAVLFAAPAFRGAGLPRAIRRLLVASGVLAFAGLGGVAVGDMRVRNVGILGYVGIFPIAAAAMALMFYRTPARGVTPPP